MVETIFIELSLILLIALGVSAVMRILRQPLIIGYIITGIIVGPLLFNLVTATETVLTFSKIGIAFLLFIVGIHLNPRVIKGVGSAALLTGVGQIIFTSVIGFFIAQGLGFSLVPSLYIAIALTLSSTILITKLLSDKGDLETLYGKISVGFLIVQDIFIAFLMIFISTVGNETSIAALAISTFVKGSLSIVALYFIGVYILPPVTKKVAKSQEFLFIFAISWCFIIASLFHFIGFSIEIGALLAGISLSMSPYSIEMGSKVRPIRDFFIIIFFIFVGLQMQAIDWNLILIPATVLSLFVLIGNPFILMVIMGMLGFTKRTGFLTGITSAQISEFSLILIALGVSVGHVAPRILPLVTLIGIITIFISTYMITYSSSLYRPLSGILSIFERKSKLKYKKDVKKNFDVILFGYNRIGYNLLNSITKLNKSSVVIDFNPDTISELTKKKINCIYGDADDSEFLQELHFKKTKMVLSTVPSFETNLLIIEKVREQNPRAIIITVAHQINDAILMYEKGASYVLLPHFLGGEYASKMIEHNKFNYLKYKEDKEKHIDHLMERTKVGHEHPRHEKER